MADWTNIANTALQPGAPVRSIDGVALRDNPIAIAEGAAGAPRIAGQTGPAVQTNGIFNSAVTNAKIANGAVNSAKLATGTNERDWVLARTAGASAGAVGTYAFLVKTSGGALGAGGTIAGSNLRYAALVFGNSHNHGFSYPAGNILPATTSHGTSSGTPSGTWRIMGYVSGANQASLFLRIS